MYGKLILCATPIGNLKDITLRVLETLKSVDTIACEDTRHSMGLLSHYDIHVPLTSYHEHNKYKKAHVIIGMIKEGRDVALITDAGTPAISDPGEVLVSMCREEGITVTSLPGPSACITALTLSGIDTGRFCFEGFLSGESKKRRAILDELRRERRTIILYEAPHHLKKTLRDLQEVLGDRRIALCRELTKQFEEVVTLTLSEAVSLYEEKDPRGEYVLVIGGVDPAKSREDDRTSWEELSLIEHVALYEESGLSRKDAIKAAADDRGVSKRDVYAAVMIK